MPANPVVTWYSALDGPSLERLDDVKDRSRQNLPWRDKSVVFKLEPLNGSETIYFRTTITKCEPQEGSRQVAIEGYYLGQKLVAIYNPHERTGIMSFSIARPRCLG